MSQVAEAVFKIFKPEKLNYELLGNKEPHLHWHIIPRYRGDPNPKNPIWVVSKEKRAIKSTKLNKIALSKIKRRLWEQIEKSQLQW